MSEATILLGDARELLPTLDLRGAVVITDPPWLGGEATGIIGAGAGAHTLWGEVVALLGDARAVVVYQTSLEPPFTPPPNCRSSRRAGSGSSRIATEGTTA